MTDGTDVRQAAEWRQTACILCECNCGVEVRLGGDGRTFERVRGDKAHPASKGYTCEKALRLDYYQNGRGERLLSPLRRRPDGTFEEIDWDTAIREVAERLAAVRDTHGGEAIVYYGGGGQGNHLGGVVRLGDPGRARCSVQGERDLAGEDRRDAGDGQDVRNAAARRLRALRGGVLPGQEPVDLPRDPARPHHAQGDRRRSRPGDGRDRSAGDRDGGDGRLPPPGAARPRCAWLIAAMAAVLVDEGLVDLDWLGAHASGFEPVLTALGRCRSPGTARSAASTRRWCAPPPGGSRRPPAWPRSRTSACR